LGTGCSGGGVVAPEVSDPGEVVPGAGVPFGGCRVELELLVLGAVPGLGLAVPGVGAGVPGVGATVPGVGAAVPEARFVVSGRGRLPWRGALTSRPGVPASRSGFPEPAL
jgi:hypothetical protein